MLYKIWRKNPYFKMGDVYRLLDDGCEKCIMRDENGRQKLMGYSGFVIPFKEIAPFAIRIQHGGLDMRALLARQQDAG